MLPIECEGLRVRDLRQMNLAFMAKLEWKIFQNKELWTGVMRKKYMQGQIKTQDLKCKVGASNLWLGIMKAKPILIQDMRKLVGNGKLQVFGLTDSYLMKLCFHTLRVTLA